MHYYRKYGDYYFEKLLFRFFKVSVYFCEYKIPEYKWFIRFRID